MLEQPMRSLLAAFALPLAACGKTEAAVQPAPTASSLAVSSASAASAGGAIWHYVIDPKGMSHIDMPGVTEHITADTTASAGTLDVVPGDLARSRGLVRIDLTTLATNSFHDEERDAKQTTHARTWLEAVVEGKTNEAMRWADFAVRSVDGLSATDITKVQPASDGLRKVTAVVHGDLLIHGHKLPKDDAVELAFEYAPGAVPGPNVMPSRIGIRSTQPVHVVLKEHEVEPRDPGGKLAKWTTALISKVAETADVAVNIAAVPAP
jgi:hypothetical protein